MEEVNGDLQDNLINNTESVNLFAEPFQYLPPEDVPCDSCLDSPCRAMKTCLTCLVSYCEAHLRPHLLNTKFQNHRLVDPLHDTNCRVCEVHHLPFVRFCMTDSCCVCLECEKQQHKGHPTVSMREARSGIEVWRTLGPRRRRFQCSYCCCCLQAELQKKCEEISASASEAETTIEELKSNHVLIKVRARRD